MSFKRLLLFLPAIIFASVVFEGCSNKGCTDKEAINFNVVADKDNGSCIYCDSTLVQTGQDSVVVTDFNSSSSHYLETVAKVTVTQKRLTFNDALCGNQKCSITYTVENLIEQDFDVTFFLQCSSSNIFFSTSDIVTVSAGQVSNPIQIPETAISNPCGTIFPGTVSIPSSSVTLVYH